MITDGKFVLLNESLKAIKNKDINILTLNGSPGMGKTFTTLKYLKEQGINYAYINSYSTPLSFYELLYKNRNKEVIIFDDLHGANNPLVISLLKAACWISDEGRIVSYHSTSPKLDLHKLPESFEFTPAVILIFNHLINDYKPVINRGLIIDFNFDFEEKLMLFEEIKKNAEIDDDVLDYVKKNCSSATENLSIRSLVILSKLKKSGQDFELFAKEMLPVDEDKRMLMEMSWKEWTTKTGQHRSTYFRHKTKYGLKESQSRRVAGDK